MAIKIITNPEILVQLSIPSESVLIDNFALTLNAIRNNTNFEFQREDVSINTVTDNGSGYCRVRSVNAMSFENGTAVYLSSGNYSDNGLITGSGLSGGLNYIDLDIEYLNDTSGGFINVSNRKNYEVQVRMYYGYINYTLYPFSIKGVPDLTGNCIVDISTALRYICSKENNINYDYESSQDLTNSGMFKIEYREVYKGYEGSWVTAESYWQYVYSVLQPPRAIYNNIMELYEFSFSRNTKFLSAFEKPKYFSGYPFSVSYFMHVLFIDNTLQFNKLLKYKNINKVVRDSETIGLPNANNFGLMHTIIEDISCDDSYVSIQLNIADGDCQSNCYVEPNYIECGYVACGTGSGTGELPQPPPPPPVYPEANIT